MGYFLLSIALIIITLIFTDAWSWLKNKLWRKNSDVYICAYVMEKFYTLPTQGEKTGKITINAIKHPKNIYTIPDATNPVKFFPVEYAREQNSKNRRPFFIVIENKGKEISKNIKIKISFEPQYAIVSSNIEQNNRINLIQGGVTGSFLVFIIPELLPNETQNVEIVTNAKNISFLDGWSENEKEIKKLFIIDISLENK